MAIYTQPSDEQRSQFLEAARASVKRWRDALPNDSPYKVSAEELVAIFNEDGGRADG